MISIISEKRGKEVIRITDFPASSIFDDIEVCPQSLQVSDAIFVIRHIPKHLNKISYFPLSIPEIEISSEIYSNISKINPVTVNKIIIPAESATPKANSGRYCFKRIIIAVEISPVPAIIKISFIIQKRI